MLLYYCILDFCLYFFVFYIFFFKQKTAYEMRISDWSSDVCSSDLFSRKSLPWLLVPALAIAAAATWFALDPGFRNSGSAQMTAASDEPDERSEEHTSELQSLMRILSAVFCLNKKKFMYNYILIFIN